MINSKYFRVPKKKEPLQENEVHVTSRQEPINFIRYAIFLFEKRNLPYIKFKASGSAIASLVNIAEILKKVIPGIHQVNRLFTLKYEQDYEPKEKGLDHVTITRNVPVLEITFSKVLLENDDVNHYGYQPAINPEVFERVKINVANLIRKRTFGGAQRGGSYAYRDNTSYYSGQTGYTGGRSQRGGYQFGFRGGRGNRKFTPGFRGRARGAQGGHYGDHGQFEGSSEIGSEYSRGRGRGRGRGFGKYRSKFDNVEPRDNSQNN